MLAFWGTIADVDGSPVRFSAELGINLTSTLDSAQSDRQIFTVTEISTTEPDPSFFPASSGLSDRRSSEGCGSG